MMHGWQSESADGQKAGWSCVFGVVAVVTSKCSVVSCNVVVALVHCSVIVAVVDVVAVVVVMLWL